MNYTIKVFLILIVIGLSNGAYETRHQLFLASKENMVLRQSNLGRALLSLITMYTESETDKISMEDLFVALEKLK